MDLFTRLSECSPSWITSLVSQSVLRRGSLHTSHRVFFLVDHFTRLVDCSSSWITSLVSQSVLPRRSLHSSHRVFSLVDLFTRLTDCFSSWISSLVSQSVLRRGSLHSSYRVFVLVDHFTRCIDSVFRRGYILTAPMVLVKEVLTYEKECDPWQNALIVFDQQTRDIHPMLSHCWDVTDGGPTVTQPCVNVSYLLGDKTYVT